MCQRKTGIEAKCRAYKAELVQFNKFINKRAVKQRLTEGEALEGQKQTNMSMRQAKSYKRGAGYTNPKNKQGPGKKQRKVQHTGNPGKYT